MQKQLKNWNNELNYFKRSLALFYRSSSSEEIFLAVVCVLSLRSPAPVDHDVTFRQTTRHTGQKVSHFPRLLGRLLRKFHVTEMYKNQLQELAQRSCFNLPSYSCIREGPDHAPRFKAKVNFSGEVFESPTFCSTLRQAEHTAAEVALKTLSIRGPSRVLAARVLDETGMYKNLLQETAHMAGLKLPVYTIVRSGPGHVPVFTCTIELGGMSFIGELARTKKQAQKIAAMTAWFALKELSWSGASSSPLSEFVQKDEQEQVTVARFLASLKSAETNKLIQKGCCYEHLELARRRDVMSYQSCRSFYPMQSQSGAYSHFFPKPATCKAHPQGIVSERQSFVLSVPSAPTFVPGPQSFPFVRSSIRPDHSPQFLARGREPLPFVPGIRPFFYFSDDSMPVPVGSISRLTIEEIDENSQVEDEWLANNANSSGWNLNFPSNASGFSSTEFLNCADSLKLPNTGNSRLKDIHQKGEFNRIPPGFLSQRPRATSTGNEIFCPQKAMSSSFVQSNVKPQSSPMDGSPRMARDFAPPLPLAPVVVRNVEAPAPLLSARRPSRTAVSVGSTGPCWLGGAKNIRGMPCASSMAPPVQIRTVVPVCSAAPPARRTPNPGQEGVSVFPSGGRKMAS